MSCAVRPLAAADLDAVLAIAAVSPEAPLWRRLRLRACSWPMRARANPNLLRAGLRRPGRSAERAGARLRLRHASSSTDRRIEPNWTRWRCSQPPAARESGLRCCGAILAWAAAEGAHRVALEVRESNAAAFGLYARFGFVRKAGGRATTADPEEDALLLGRAITPGRPPGRFSTENGVEGGPPQC